MKKSLALILFILFATASFGVARGHKVRLHHTISATKSWMPTGSVSADSLLEFARSLIGVRYLSRSSNPLRGFDCSGFVSYVFKRFNFDVPRSSYDFINIGQKIRLEDARPGDIILFTGTKKHSRRIGHVAILYSTEDNGIQFIHSTSGKEHGVTITNMDDTYKRRFVQVIRLI